MITLTSGTSGSVVDFCRLLFQPVRDRLLAAYVASQDLGAVEQLVAAVVRVDADHSWVKVESCDKHHPAPQSFDTIFAAPE